MDTKLRSTRYSVWLKVLALACAVGGVLLMAAGLMRYEGLSTALEPDNYLYTSDLRQWVGSVLSTVEGAELTFDSEEEILSDANRDKALDDSEVTWRTDSAQIEITSIGEQYATYINDAFQSNDDADSRDAEVKRLESERDQKIAARKQQLEDDLDAARDEEVQRQLAQYRSSREELTSLGAGVQYGWRSEEGYYGGTIGRGEAEMERAAKACPVYYISVDGKVTTNLPELGYGQLTLGSDKASLWLGISQAAFDARRQSWLQRWNLGREGWTLLGSGFLLALLGLGWLCYAAGRRPAQEGVTLLAIDNLPLDLGLVLPASAIGGAALAAYVYFTNETLLHSGVTTLPLVGAGLLLALATMLLALYLTMFAKRLKRREVLRHTVAAWVLRGLNRALERFLEVIAGGPVPPQAALLALVLAGFTLLGGMIGVNLSHSSMGAFFLWCLFVLGVDFFAALWLIRRFQRLLRGVERIRKGDLHYRLPAGGSSLTAQLGDRINHIADGLNTAVEREVRSERMKSELVTNVSHDLKTPLTSLITYLDLLAKEGLQAEKAPHYLEVLQAKAQRLKVLTEDLVEAARAASGAVAVQRERLDLTALLQQSLGEYEPRLAAAELTVRFTSAGERIAVLADGRLLWRVVDNLLGNACKYALPGSRVYLDVGREGDRVRFTLKNISAQELNVAAEELTERFVRGDEARTGEGSGLGLSIAKNLTELMDGTFALTVDGDLFKVTVTVPAAPALAEPASA